MPATVTLLTDFGTADYFVAAMKGVILTRAPGTTLVDVTHQIPPQDVRAAAFTLMAAYPEFPPGSIHVAVVDPGVGSQRRPIAVAAGTHLFVGPDNGLFSHVYQREPGARAFHLNEPSFFRPPVSTTFHGRDIFAPVAGALAAGVPVERLGPQIEDPVHWAPQGVERTGSSELRGAILHIDRFGNCITNLTREHLGEEALSGGFRLRVGGHDIVALRRFFAEGEGGEPFVIWGSAGFLEIACNRESAAHRLGVQPGDSVSVQLR